MPRIDVGTAIDSIKDEGIAALPAAEYAVKVEVAELRDNKAGDAKLLYMEYSVREGEFEGRKLFDRISMKPTALWRLKRFLKAAEVPYEGSGFATEDVLGSKLSVQVTTVPSRNNAAKLVNEVADYVIV